MERTKCFKDGQEHHVGRPTTARTEAQVAKVKKVLDTDRHLTIVNEKGVQRTGSTPSRRFKWRRQRLSTVFQKQTSSGLLTSGRCTELSVLKQEECILNIIK